MRYTKHQGARDTRPDAENFNELLLIKRCPNCGISIRLLTYPAVSQHKKFVIEVPKNCKVHAGLKELVKQHSHNVQIGRAQMGLYLAIFDDGQEVDGVDVGSYSDFTAFRDAVIKNLERGMRVHDFPR